MEMVVHSNSLRISRFPKGIPGIFVLIIGVAIYWFFRPPKLSFLDWPDWVAFSLPDGPWTFAYALFITSIWNGRKSSMKFLWHASIPILTFGHLLCTTTCLVGVICIGIIFMPGYFIANNLQILNHEKK